jgi:hypothetical protein
MEMHKESGGALSSELPCYGLAAAKAEAKRLVLSANPVVSGKSICMNLQGIPRVAAGDNVTFDMTKSWTRSGFS